MKHDVVEINGQPWRVEFNWNTIAAFLEANNLELSAVDELQKLKPSQITVLIHEALKEGARMESKEFPYSVKDIGSNLSVTDIAALLTVFQKHVSAKNANTDGAKKKKFFSRKN